MRVRRAGLVEEVVAVVPPGDQAEVVERREGGGAGPDDAAHVAPEDLEPRGVASLWTLVGGQPDVLARPQESGQRAVDAVDVAVVRDDDEGPAAGGHRGRRGHGEGGRPVLVGRAARAGRARRPPGPHRRAMRRSRASPAGYADHGPGSGVGDQRGVGRAGLVERALGGGVALGDGQPQHVAEDAGVAVGDGAGEGQDLGGEDRFGADHAADVGQPAGVLGVGPALDDEPVQVAPGEPDPHPAPRLGVLRQLGRDAVLEDPVQVRQAGVDDDRGDRQRDRVDVAAVVDIVASSLSGPRSRAQV